MQSVSLWQKIFLVMFGITIAAILGEGSLRITGLVMHQVQISGHEKVYGSTFRILALGESTTAEMTLSDRGTAWPSQLEALLNNRSESVSFEVINEGIPGTDTSRILASLEYNLDKYNPDMVITMMGINDEEGPKGNLQDTSWVRQMRLYKLVTGLYSEFFEEKSLPQATGDLWDMENVQNEENMQDVEIGTDCRNIPNAIEAGTYLPSQGGYRELELCLKTALTENSKSQNVMLLLAELYENENKPVLAEEMYNKAIQVKRTSRNLDRYAWFLSKQGRISEAVQYFNASLEINPTYESCIGLAYALVKLADFTKSLEFLGMAQDLEPDNPKTIVALRYLNSRRNTSGKSDELVNLGASNQYLENGWKEFKEDNLIEAEAYFEKVMQMEPENQYPYRGLAWIYIRMGRTNDARAMLNKASYLASQYYRNQTRQNYLSIYEVLKNRKVEVLFMQYPTREIDDFRRFFRETGTITFVSNQEVFMRALSIAPYKDYFFDNFAGDFGHCTEKGNRLIAENLAPIILEMVGAD